MPSLGSELLSSIEGLNPLPDVFPEFYAQKADYYELGIRWTNVALSDKFSSLHLKSKNNIHILDVINASRAFETGQMMWNSIRAEDEHLRGVKPTGWEYFRMQGSESEAEIILHIAMLGIQAQRENPRVINQIRVGGFSSLSLDQLREADKIIATLLAQEKATMTSAASDFRQAIVTEIKSLPKELAKSYYFHDKRTNQIIAYGTTLTRLPPHSSFRKIPDWQEVLRQARTHNFDGSIQGLARGVKIVDELGHGMGSFNEGLLSLI